MSDREMFMYEIWMRIQDLRFESQKRLTKPKDYDFYWSCSRAFWIPILSPIADAAGY